VTGAHLLCAHKPFGAKPAFKSNPFFSNGPSHNQSPTALLGRKQMSDKFSSDRMAAFTPQIPKRVADIPNLVGARGTDVDIDGKRLVIGKQIRMSGEISGCERLVVEGKVDAKLSEVKTLDVTANGSFKGSAEVDNAVIAGVYEGDLRVRGHLEIAPSGMVKGSVAYKTIVVANGGKILGSIETIDG
jgi:cytoskeletal protein CcmA (bactofilin family)